MEDQNDIVFEQQSFDLIGIIQAVIEAISGADMSTSGFLETLSTLWGVFVVVSFLFAALCFVGFVYASIRFGQLSEIQSDEIKEKERLWQQLYGGAGEQPSRMEDIAAHIQTDNPNDWKLAVIEADIELERILESAGYAGSTVGDKLKNARTTGAMQTIDDAWEAHLIRNKIAHQGADFVLTKKIAQETINRYKRVFAELGG